SRLLIRGQSQLPEEFTKRYRKNVVNLTPKKTGALRRSIVTRTLKGQGEIGWRSQYAAAQNAGHHTVSRTRTINIDGRFVTLHPGVYSYRNYTTQGTGPRFAVLAYQKTVREMPAVIRELGLTK